MPSGRASRRRKGRRARSTTRKGLSPALIGAVAVLAMFAGAVGFGVYWAARERAVIAAAGIPPGATRSGVPSGRAEAPATIDVYLDFQCPACRTYEQETRATIDELVASGAAHVVYHPVAYLDRFSTTRYSSRSSAAAGCAAEAGVYPPFARLLLAHQPPEGGHGLTDEELVALGRQAGAGPGFADCVSSGRYTGWAAGLTDEASRDGVTATPTVEVNGRAVPLSAAALRAAVGAPS